MTDVDFLGPFFGPQRGAIIAAFEEAIKREVAAQALADVQEILDANIKRPTPYYETQINIARDGDDLLVNDRGIVYGPWLEGTSKRNEETSFKGYHAFRVATEHVNQRVGDLIGHVMRTFIGRLNG